MKRNIFTFALIVLSALATQAQNSADLILQSDKSLTIGGYGHIDYSQPTGAAVRKNGTMDVTRMVLLFGYKFDSRTQFITEIEYEHVSELYVEQAFLQYKFNPAFQFRGGLLLIPMGRINEYHEPLAFRGVKRPFIDNVISPTTWREIGVGFTGLISSASLKYQAYLVNGFNGYNGKGVFSGASGFRGGRQKGANSYISSPNFSAKAEYFGVKNLQIGAAIYAGKSQSTRYNNLDEENQTAVAQADSSVVGITMLGLDAVYRIKALELKGQLYYTAISNSDNYNRFTRTGSKNNDLGSSMMGYYLEAGYNVLSHFEAGSKELIPFVRWESYDTHFTTGSSVVRNQAYQKYAITTGIDFKLNKNAVLKADFQWQKSEADKSYSKTINAGIGVMF